MNLLKTLAFGTAILTMIGCSKIDEPQQAVINHSEQDATVKVSVIPEKSNLRAMSESEKISNNKDNEIKSLHLLVYSGDVLEGEAFYDSKSDALKDKSHPSTYELETKCKSGGNKTIVILANETGSTLEFNSANKKIFNKFSLNELKKSFLYVDNYAVSDREDEDKNEDSDDIYKYQPMLAMYGPCEIKKGKNYLGKFSSIQSNEHQINKDNSTLPLKRMLGKIIIKDVQRSFNDAIRSEYDIKFESIHVLLAKKHFHPLIDHEYASTDKYYFFHGFETSNFTPNQKYLEGIIDKSGSIISPHNYTINKKQYQRKGYIFKNGIEFQPDLFRPFYVAPNTDKKHPTIVCVKAKVMKSKLAGDCIPEEEISEEQKKTLQKAGKVDEKGYTYYPFVVNMNIEGEKSNNKITGEEESQGKGILPNHRYYLTFNIKGLGTNKPHDGKGLADLSVNCELKDWTNITQEETWD